MPDPEIETTGSDTCPGSTAEAYTLANPMRLKLISLDKQCM